jgi:hypothetical protein
MQPQLTTWVVLCKSSAQLRVPNRSHSLTPGDFRRPLSISTISPDYKPKYFLLTKEMSYDSISIRDGFTGEGGGGAIFHDKAKNY